MGIKNLTQLLKEFAPNSIKEIANKDQFKDRWVAIDASTSLQQFLVAIRSASQSSEQFSANAGLLVNDKGEVTSHLQGFLNRTIAMLDMNIRPVYVFDGKPPDMKRGELKKRMEAKDKAKIEQEKAQDAGDTEEALKQAKRQVKITPLMKQQTMDLLKQMGVPYIVAPCEAEATCVAMLKQNFVFAVASEDGDCLTHGCSKLVRYLFNNRKDKSGKQISPTVFHLDVMLQELEMTQDEFIDLCIMCGCDYLDSPKGMGFKTAYKMIKEYRSIEACISSGKIKESETEFIENQNRARMLFKEGDVTQFEPDFKLKINAPDEGKLIELMVEQNGFNKEIIDKRIQTLKSFDRNGKQTRIGDFFKTKKMITNDKSFEVSASKLNNSVNKSGSKTAINKDKKKKK